ncbi:hypothetical protein [Streptomyces nojiriensis]|uniref:hypothetical protein n=1 Tax=Streptomyces nojiriensis TaxID=66374 RepID=UPI0036521E31
MESEDRVLLAEVGRAAAATWRRRHGDFPPPVGGTGMSPEFHRTAVVARLLAHGRIAVATQAPTVAPAVADSRGTRRFRRQDPYPLLADDAAHA